MLALLLMTWLIVTVRLIGVNHLAVALSKVGGGSIEET
jgi:hypothetical protein